MASLAKILKERMLMAAGRFEPPLVFSCNACWPFWSDGRLTYKDYEVPGVYRCLTCKKVFISRGKRGYGG